MRTEVHVKCRKCGVAYDQIVVMRSREGLKIPLWYKTTVDMARALVPHGMVCGACGSKAIEVTFCSGESGEVRDEIV